MIDDDATKTLYERLGGYNAIAAVANDLLPRDPIHSSGASGRIAERMA